MENEDMTTGADMDDVEDIIDSFNVGDDIESLNNNQIKPELRRLYQQHPECKIDYIENISAKLPLKTIPGTGPNSTLSSEYVDKNHRTYPFITNYEKTRIIGMRSNQLSLGARPFVVVPKHVTCVKEIARMEFDQKRLPIIIRRPMPNGSAEYWKLADLMVL